MIIIIVVGIYLNLSSNLLNCLMVFMLLIFSFFFINKDKKEEFCCFNNSANYYYYSFFFFSFCSLSLFNYSIVNFQLFKFLNLQNNILIDLVFNAN